MRGPETAIDHPPDTDRVLTVANVISLIRLAGIPVFAWVLLGLDRRYLAAWLLFAIGCTDWIDGGIARKYHQVTTFGKILDPTIDRLLLGVAAISSMIDGSLPVWLGVVLLAREVLIGLGGIYLGLKGHRRISVTWWGKVYSFGLMGALPLFLVGNTSVFWSGVAEVLAWVLVIPSALLSYITAAQYIKKARAALGGSK